MVVEIIVGCNISGSCQQGGKTIVSTSESSPEPGTDLGALSVGSSGGNLNPAQEQSRRDTIARENFLTINHTLRAVRWM
jgi:hypothetical protein